MDSRRKPKTVAEAFGPEVADELARWAIDVLCSGELPVKANVHAYAAKVPWRKIDEGRALLEGAGIDWRDLHAKQVELYRAASERSDAAERARKITEQEARGL